MFNWVKTAMLMAAITALFIVIGGLIGGHRGMMLALFFALAMNFFSYWYSDKMVLRMYNAQEVDETTAPQFYRMVRDLATRAGLPMPRVYLINDVHEQARSISVALYGYRVVDESRFLWQPLTSIQDCVLIY